MKHTNQTARSVCLQALLQMEKDDGYSNVVLDRVLSGCRLSGRDKALASTVFYGVLERRIPLDYYLTQFLRDPKKNPEPAAMAALRVGAYQILYLDRVPGAAAVYETVQALKIIGKPRLAGFVNGVLRNLLRKLPLPALPEGDDLRSLSLRYSVPEELVRLWQGAYGASMTRRLLESFQEKPEMDIRVNLTRCTVEELRARLERRGVELVPLANPVGAAVLKGCGSPRELPEFSEGLFHVQDLSAQLVCGLLGARPGETVCDCCAAPGGKTFTIAQEVGGSGKVYAFDLYESRVRLIADGANRLGLGNVQAGANDAVKGFGSMPQVDRVLCDVPCSGFGVIRRKPEIRYRDLAEVRDLPELQYAILRQGAEKVKPGGVLVYSTCTLNPAENSQVAERFLKENNGFQPMKIDIGTERWLNEPDYMLTMAPFSGGSDGFFAAAFRREE